jgi:hypothetical protein
MDGELDELFSAIRGYEVFRREDSLHKANGATLPRQESSRYVKFPEPEKLPGRAGCKWGRSS